MTTDVSFKLPFILIPLLCLFTYQAAINSIAAVQVDNAYYYLQQAANNDASPEADSTKKLLFKAQKSLTTVGNLTPDDPAYNNLLSNLKIWQVLSQQMTQESSDEILQQAKTHYQSALQDQPNNAYLWIGLAKTDYSKQKKIYAINAMNQASHYAPSDQSILKQAVLWKLPIWTQLTPPQQNETITQLEQLIKARTTSKKTKQKLKNLLNKREVDSR